VPRSSGEMMRRLVRKRKKQRGGYDVSESFAAGVKIFSSL
jgi:hypothetical protein